LNSIVEQLPQSELHQLDVDFNVRQPWFYYDLHQTAVETRLHFVDCPGNERFDRMHLTIELNLPGFDARKMSGARNEPAQPFLILPWGTCDGACPQFGWKIGEILITCLVDRFVHPIVKGNGAYLTNPRDPPRDVAAHRLSRTHEHDGPAQRIQSFHLYLTRPR